MMVIAVLKDIELVIREDTRCTVHRHDDVAFCVCG